VREAIREELLRGAATAGEISQRVSIREKDVAEHLQHLEKSLRARGERLVIQPASCIRLRISFVRRARLDAPRFVSGMLLDAHRPAGVPDRGCMSAAMGLVVAVVLVGACDAARAGKDALTGASPPPANLQLQDGDLVFHQSRSAQSAARGRRDQEQVHAYGSRAAAREQAARLWRAVQPTKLTPLAAWVARGDRGKVVIKRLKSANEVFTAEVRRRMHEMGRGWLGRPYDPLFQWTDDRLYCSELVYKLLDRAAASRWASSRRRATSTCRARRSRRN